MSKLGKKFVLFHAIWAAIVIAWLFPNPREKDYAFQRRLFYTVGYMGTFLSEWARRQLFEYQQRHPMYGYKRR